MPMPMPMPMPANTTRTLRLKRSMGSNNLTCCLHPSFHHHNNNRSLPPNPDDDDDNEPARPSPLTLDSIFALAALPSNHPHALGIGLPPASASEEDGNDQSLSIPKSRIVRKSPSSSAFGLALRRLRRRATFGDVRGSRAGGVGAVESLSGRGRGCLEQDEGGSLRDGACFDADARRLSSGEVLGVVEADGSDASTSGFVRPAEGGHDDPPTLSLRELSPLDGSRDLDRYGILDPSSTAAGPLPLPLKRARSSFALGSSASTTTIGGRHARRQFSSEAEDIELRDLAYLNSNLDLDLAGCQLDGMSNSNNSRVDDDDSLCEDVVGVVETQDRDSGVMATGNGEEPVLTSGGLDISITPFPPHIIKPDDGEDNQNDDKNTSGSRADSHASFHLTKTHISQQLRSMSQLSGRLSDSSEQPMPAETWTFHYRERSGNFLSASAIDVNFNSSRSLHVAREYDASSSVYSRPTSPEADQVVAEPYELKADLVEAVGDWPLKEGERSVLSEQQAGAEGALGEDCPAMDEDAHITIVEPALPTIVTPTILEPGILIHDDTPGRAPSYKSGSSSTTKRSRFLERFTPPKRLVTKRRSIFKFLRPGSRRDQTRSISTPALLSPHLRPYVDGPADENELVTVQYELPIPENNATRSVSLSNLPVPTTNESQGVASSPDLRRKPSLADYERHLSIVGDSRRLPSTTKDLNLHRLSQIEEDDKHEHVSAKNSFSYHSKTQMTDPLMEAALERQLREKAMFRSASKRSIPQSEVSGTSFLATSWDEPSSLQPQSPDRDPLDSAAGKRPSASHLSPPRTPIENRSRNSSLIATVNQRPTTTSGKKARILHTPSSISRSSIRSKIGSSLDSWSRYPSHTRGERCASAGRADNVRTLDFALDIDHERIGRGGTDESDPFHPGSSKRVLTGKHSSRSKTKSLPKSRSATFGGTFARYYGNLFSSPADFHGKGRRTSVVVGGKLHRPELEILPPVLPPCSSSPVSQSALLYVHELEELRPGCDSTLLTRDHTGGSAGKGKSPLLFNKDVVHDLQNSDDCTASSSNPVNFRNNSPFKPLSSEILEGSDRTAKVGQDTSQPDGSEDYFSARMGSSSRGDSEASSTKHAEENLAADVDGTLELVDMVETTMTTDPTKRQTPTTPILTPSKSQAWSELYQECLVVPPSPVDANNDEERNLATRPSDTNPNSQKNNNTMAPPPPPSSLNPTKLRSSPVTSSLNPTMAIAAMETETGRTSTATIRRYPSVTVIDDRKGHWRSVSFISVQSGKSGVGASAAGSRAGSRTGSHRAESFVREGSGIF